MTTDTKLLPCPFCGANARFEMDDARWEWVECESCGMQSNRGVSLMEDCKPMLADAWNTRAERKPLTDAQIRCMCAQPWVFDTVKQWVRITEAAHGIKGSEHDQHPDDAAVDALAAKMKAKLAKQRAKGYKGWDSEECSHKRLTQMLRSHVEKGDPVDVANFCAFLSARGEGIGKDDTTASWRTLFESVMGKSPYEFEFDRWPEGHEWAGQYNACTVQCAWDAWQEAVKFLKGETNEANTVSDSGPAGSGQDDACGEPAGSKPSAANLRG